MSIDISFILTCNDVTVDINALPILSPTMYFSFFFFFNEVKDPSKRISKGFNSVKSMLGSHQYRRHCALWILDTRVGDFYSGRWRQLQLLLTLLHPSTPYSPLFQRLEFSFLLQWSMLMFDNNPSTTPTPPYHAMLQLTCSLLANLKTLILTFQFKIQYNVYPMSF